MGTNIEEEIAQIIYQHEMALKAGCASGLDTAETIIRQLKKRGWKSPEDCKKEKTPMRCSYQFCIKNLGCTCDRPSTQLKRLFLMSRGLNRRKHSTDNYGCWNCGGKLFYTDEQDKYCSKCGKR